MLKGVGVVSQTEMTPGTPDAAHFVRNSCTGIFLEFCLRTHLNVCFEFWL